MSVKCVVAMTLELRLLLLLQFVRRSEHERHSPQCPFVKGEFTQNVPLSGMS